MKARGITIPVEQLASLCRAHRIRRLALFGSVLRADFHPDSDIDVLVEFEPQVRIGHEFFTIQRKLEELFGRTVDLNTPQDLSRYFRDEVLREAENIYVAA